MDNPEQPGAELRLTPKPRQIAINPEKNFLHQIQRIIRVLHQTQTQVIDPPLMASHQRFPRCHTPRQGSLYKLQIALVHNQPVGRSKAQKSLAECALSTERMECLD